MFLRNVSPRGAEYTLRGTGDLVARGAAASAPQPPTSPVASGAAQLPASPARPPAEAKAALPSSPAPPEAKAEAKAEVKGANFTLLTEPQRLVDADRVVGGQWVRMRFREHAENPQPRVRPNRHCPAYVAP